MDATRRFEQELYVTLGKIVAELYKACRGELSDETLAVIHELLRPLSEAAVDVPETLPALQMFDRLEAMFPPRNPHPDPGGSV